MTADRVVVEGIAAGADAGRLFEMERACAGVERLGGAPIVS